MFSLQRVSIILVIASIASMASSSANAQRIGLNIEEFDKELRVQDDLYRFANGGWLESTEIPSDKSNYGAFTVLADLSRERIKSTVDKVVKDRYPNGHDRQKVGDFYRSFMDEAQIKELGLNPLADEFNRINAIETHDDVMRYFGRAQFCLLYTSPSPRDATLSRMPSSA